ncbi:MAG: hypothetical protein N2C14_02350, partial [Planctomycetales bacterium]
SPEKAKELHDALLTWRKQTAAPVPKTPNPKYNPAAKLPSGKGGKKGEGKNKGKGKDKGKRKKKKAA